MRQKTIWVQGNGRYHLIQLLRRQHGWLANPGIRLRRVAAWRGRVWLLPLRILRLSLRWIRLLLLGVWLVRLGLGLRRSLGVLRGRRWRVLLAEADRRQGNA
jgi:hypothetical protein